MINPSTPAIRNAQAEAIKVSRHNNAPAVVDVIRPWPLHPDLVCGECGGSGLSKYAVRVSSPTDMGSMYTLACANCEGKGLGNRWLTEMQKKQILEEELAKCQESLQKALQVANEAQAEVADILVEGLGMKAMTDPNMNHMIRRVDGALDKIGELLADFDVERLQTVG